MTYVRSYNYNRSIWHLSTELQYVAVDLIPDLHTITYIHMSICYGHHFGDHNIIVLVLMDK